MLENIPADWHPSRDAALKRLEEFVPDAGGAYASKRNHDKGRASHDSVSRLSPWLRHRCISEWEVVTETLKLHTASAAEKYIQEVCWRTYWKGWLEMRPQVWDQYLIDVQSLYLQPEIMQSVEETITTGTGIECFDYWCKELEETGYLHNHARMWFASIWIFTLKLPWQLGADYFMRHLLDGDPAANTLSWRWVAGLHTKGKTYLARPDNIEKYTSNRFQLTDQLASVATPLQEEDDYARQPLPIVNEDVPEGRNGLLLTDDDLHPDLLPGNDQYVSVAGVSALGLNSPGAIDTKVLAFSQSLLVEATEKLGADAHYSCHHENEMNNTVEQLVQWAVTHRMDRVVCAYAPVGANATLLKRLDNALDAQKIALHIVRRQWDSRFWPHAGKGFFALKKNIPSILKSIVDENSGQAALF